MPELPEVETTRRGVEPLLSGRIVTRVRVREPRLRWPVSLPENLRGQRFQQIGDTTQIPYPAVADIRHTFPRKWKRVSDQEFVFNHVR